MDCYNVQHDGGIGQKTVEDTTGDVSRTKICKFRDFGDALQQEFTNWFLRHIHRSFFESPSGRRRCFAKLREFPEFPASSTPQTNWFALAQKIPVLSLASSCRSGDWGAEKTGERKNKGEARREKERERLWADSTEGRSGIPGSGIPSDWSIVTGLVNNGALLTQMRNAIMG